VGKSLEEIGLAEPREENRRDRRSARVRWLGGAAVGGQCSCWMGSGMSVVFGGGRRAFYSPPERLSSLQRSLQRQRGRRCLTHPRAGRRRRPTRRRPRRAGPHLCGQARKAAARLGWQAPRYLAALVAVGRPFVASSGGALRPPRDGGRRGDAAPCRRCRPSAAPQRRCGCGPLAEREPTRGDASDVVGLPRHLTGNAGAPQCGCRVDQRRVTLAVVVVRAQSFPTGGVEWVTGHVDSVGAGGGAPKMVDSPQRSCSTAALPTTNGTSWVVLACCRSVVVTVRRKPPALSKRDHRNRVQGVMPVHKSTHACRSSPLIVERNCQSSIRASVRLAHFVYST